ncbi:MAG TPA: NADH-quinone oxidoreductase subunit C [Terriglobales bacterium]|nr:NADH-quinone oxidoreductase subunit C [Terriglobales bacterium]
MPLAPAITDIEQLKDRPEVAALLGWNADAVEGAKFDRNELTIWIKRDHVVNAARFLRDHSELRFNFLSDVTCVDWYPSEPRFEVVYHLLSIPRKSRVRLKVKLNSGDTRVGSMMSVWPSCNFFEREVFDLFGITFEGHPYLKRIMMPDDWNGHPLRKDYPVEGYR